MCYISEGVCSLKGATSEINSDTSSLFSAPISMLCSQYANLHSVYPYHFVCILSISFKKSHFFVFGIESNFMNIMSERETKKFGICIEDYRGD